MTLNDYKLLVNMAEVAVDILPHATPVHPCTMSEGFDRFAGSEMGRAYARRRVQAMDGLHQPPDGCPSTVFKPVLSVLFYKDFLSK